MNLSTNSSYLNDDHVFLTPIKLIKTIDDMQQWDKSEAYFEYLGFIYAINDSIKGKSNSQVNTNVSAEITKLISMLDILSKWIDDIPPIQQPQRFGNRAFKTFHEKLETQAITLLQSILPNTLYRAIPEIMVYLIEGFGNSVRIDYGTGHEMAFIMFLCSLYKINYLKLSDQPATATKVFVKYLDVVRKLQITYRMEPAGSHGVWSLDDFQFVPFIWGSSQFSGSGKFEPSCFLNDAIVNSNAQDYMFLSCIQYINQVKSGPFAEHSNQLWSISGVSTWSKINGGLIKMYRVEVLSKFPVIQHVYFGSLFNLNPAAHDASIRRPRLSNCPAPRLGEFKTPSGTISTTDSSKVASDKE